MFLSLNSMCSAGEGTIRISRPSLQRRHVWWNVGLRSKFQSHLWRTFQGWHIDIGQYRILTDVVYIGITLSVISVSVKFHWYANPGTLSPTAESSVYISLDWKFVTCGTASSIEAPKCYHKWTDLQSAVSGRACTFWAWECLDGIQSSIPVKTDRQTHTHRHTHTHMHRQSGILSLATVRRTSARQ